MKSVLKIFSIIFIFYKCSRIEVKIFAVCILSAGKSLPYKPEFVIVAKIYYNEDNLFGRERMEKLGFTKKDTNIIKGMAIVFLMVHHCFKSAKRYAGYEVIFSPLNQEIVTYLASFLKICVPIFVFLTAYGITVSLKIEIIL